MKRSYSEFFAVLTLPALFAIAFTVRLPTVFVGLAVMVVLAVVPFRVVAFCAVFVLLVAHCITRLKVSMSNSSTSTLGGGKSGHVRYLVGLTCGAKEEITHAPQLLCRRTVAPLFGSRAARG